MKAPKFIGVVGHKKSGKTTLIELLIKEMTAQGLKIGTVKTTSHDLEFDTPAKDTYRHRAAGSSVTLIKSKSQIALYSNQEYLNDDIIVAIFQKCNIVFVEGDSGSENPKICVVDRRGMRDDIAGKIVATWGMKSQSADIRHFETNQVKELCDFLISGR